MNKFCLLAAASIVVSGSALAAPLPGLSDEAVTDAGSLPPSSQPTGAGTAPSDASALDGPSANSGNTGASGQADTAAVTTSMALSGLSDLVDGDAATDAASAARMAAVADDPELAAILSTTAPGLPGVPTWNENASRDYYNSAINLAWQHTLGDHAPTVLGSATVTDTNQRKVVDLAVTGNDFYVLGAGKNFATFDSRYASTAYQPVLIVNGKYKYSATRNTYLSSTTVRALGGSKILSDGQVMLFAFDKYTPLAGDSAHLRLVTEKQYGTHQLTVYRPVVQPIYPVIDAPLGGTVIRDIRASDFSLEGGYKSVANNVITATWGGSRIDALSQVFPLPPGDDYFLTVVIKLGADWSNQGGKLPGLSNTGLGLNGDSKPLTVNGVVCDNAGWGGRPANGCRWSARTGWGGRSNDMVGLHTYFYAQQPITLWGWVQNWPTPAPTGHWFAYVERIKLNTIGNSDGRLSYWICTQSGCNPQFDRSNIQWRLHDLPESKITEAWSDVYCGGTTCGTGVVPTSTVSISRMTVTTGLPDLPALGAEVQALNASGV